MKHIAIILTAILIVWDYPGSPATVYVNGVPQVQTDGQAADIKLTQAVNEVYVETARGKSNTITILKGDIDGDGDVDLFDYAEWRKYYRTSIPMVNTN